MPNEVKTISVKSIDPDHEHDEPIVINETDFDPELHEKIEPAKRARLKPEKVVEPEDDIRDDNDLKEPGEPKTKAEKDRLENMAKVPLAKGGSAEDGVKKGDKVGQEAAEAAKKGYAASSPTNPATAKK